MHGVLGCSIATIAVLLFARAAIFYALKNEAG
jgi:hypothetical protein